MSTPPSSAARLDTAATEASDARAAHLAPAPPLPDASAPTAIDRFRILATLGSGGMGVVYEAHDPKLDRYVAIKLVHRRLSEREGTRLRREAQSLARLSHPNVVQVFEVGRCPYGVFLVMELVRGQSLRQWLGLRTREPAEILAMFHAAGQGLAAAHAAGLVHRDFKPSNVLVGDDGRPRVLDFGLARVGRTSASDLDSEPGDAPSISGVHDPLDDDATVPAAQATHAAAVPSPARSALLDSDSLGEDLVAARLTDHDSVLGTPAYMAPEQHLGRPLTAAADQFGFCVALYEALFHVHPFGAPEDRIHRVLIGSIPSPPPSAAASVPAHVHAALLRGLSRHPGDRFPSMQTLLHALRPPSRRPRLVIAAAIIGTTAALATTLWAAITPRQDPCTAGPERLAAAWDEQRQAARTGMLATDLPYAAETWARTEARLREYGDAWLDSYARTCEAGVQGTLSPAELDGRMRCLDERRQAMGALVGELASADAFTVLHAIEAVGQLPATEDCEDAEYLRGRLPPPAEAAPEVERLRARLASVRALYLTGRHAEGLARAGQLRLAVEAVGYPPLTAELELAEGMLHIRAGDPVAARERLEAAYFLGKELAHDRVALEAAMNLVFVASTLDHDAPDAKTWLDHAAAELPLAGTPSLRASYEGLRGVVAANAQDHGHAILHHRRAAELHEAARGPHDPAVARSLANYGLSLAWLGRFDESVEMLERAIAIEEQQLGPRHPDLALHLNNLGIVLFNHGDARAREPLERALAIRTQILEPDHLDIANTLEQLGRAHVSAGRLDEARPLVERALEIRRRKQGPEHLQLAFTLGALGELQLQQGETTAAERTFREALTMAEATAPEHSFVAYAQGWLGEALMEEERWAEGTAVLRESLARIEAANGPDHPELMGPLQGLAGAALEQGRPADALPFAERSLAVGERTDQPAARLAIARWLVAQALWDTGGDRARARTLAEQAVAAWEVDASSPGRLAEARRWLAERPP